MADLFFDTSAMLKRWVREAGTERVRELTASAAGHRVLVTRLLVAEAVGQLARRAAGGRGADEAVRRAVAAVHGDATRRFQVVEIGVLVWTRAVNLAERRRLRGADAVHLAAACVVQERGATRGAPPLTFVTSDADQISAAIAEGLEVEIPALRR